MQPQAAYDELLRRSREDSLLASCAELLGWDEETRLPHGGVTHRSRQLALLAGIQHDRTTDPHLGELLAAVEGSELVRDPWSDAAVNVREWRRAYGRAVRLPRALVEELARTVSLAQQDWVEARRRSSYALLRPRLERIMALKRQEAACYGSASDAYDALLEEYEPAARGQEIVRLFDALRRELVPLVAATRGSAQRPDVALLHRAYPLDRQQVFGETAAAALGFDFRAGRLDTSAHPFSCRIGPGDCRITTRYDLHDFTEAFYGILHEVGHALYSQGLDPAHYGTPRGEAVSLGVHESQSRLWENLVGRGLPFWRHFFPRARQVFHATLADVNLEDFYFALNAVEPSLNRVRADEATYNLHVLVRFELERALIDGGLRTADLPAAWNEAYRHYLGVVPHNDAEGCLQDGHWASGLVGYFPTYTLGNLFAAQLFARARQELGDLDEALARGEFAVLLDWLRAKVYREGSRYPAARLLEHVTGSPPDHRPLVDHLWGKYGRLYGVEGARPQVSVKSE